VTAVLPEKINLEIVTPEQLLFSGEVDEVMVPAVEGYMGILPGHAPLLSELQIGVISFRQGDQQSHLFCSWGFLEVLSDRVSVLAERAESPEQIDVEQARLDQQQVEQLLASPDEETDHTEAMLKLHQAVTRLEVVSRAGGA
jgi:F-type H+-transporting ATPase subunit epsilon